MFTSFALKPEKLSTSSSLGTHALPIDRDFGASVFELLHPPTAQIAVTSETHAIPNRNPTTDMRWSLTCRDRDALAEREPPFKPLWTRLST